mmetsp:Transcript_13569/g.42490  ORF Transcript_13569/g.42490 Transcript_13569/m.42490 type:complete len:200 (+) Transcript_13569:1265-1864(+)
MQGDPHPLRHGRERPAHLQIPPVVRHHRRHARAARRAPVAPLPRLLPLPVRRRARAAVGGRCERALQVGAREGQGERPPRAGRPRDRRARLEGGRAPHQHDARDGGLRLLAAQHAAPRLSADTSRGRGRSRARARPPLSAAQASTPPRRGVPLASDSASPRRVARRPAASQLRRASSWTVSEIVLCQQLRNNFTVPRGQ